MLQKSNLLFLKTFSTSSFRNPRIERWRKQINQTFTQSDLNSRTEQWRAQIDQTQLIDQVSRIILQRHTRTWEPLFKKLNLHTIIAANAMLTPDFCLQVFNNIQEHPQILLDFFNWAKNKLEFKPDLQTQCEVVTLLFGSGLSIQGKMVLYSLIESYSPAEIVSSIVETCDKGTIFDDFYCILNSVVECYCSKKMYLEALEVYRKAKDWGVVVSVCSCNALLSLLCDKNEVDLAWCLYGSLKRIGVMEDQLTWSTIGEILNKRGKCERVEMILGMGIYSPVLYNLMIEFHSRGGNFEAAFCYLDEMCGKKLDPSFNTYSSILDDACRYQDEEVTQKVISLMVEKRFLPKDLMSECALIIQKLSDMGKLYAAEFVFRKADNENVQIQNMSYGCMLQALSKEGRIKDAVYMHQIISRRNILVNDGCYRVFLESLCQERLSDEVSESLKYAIGRGFRPSGTLLSKCVNFLCDGKRWNQAEELLDIVLDKGFSLDSGCCWSLVKWYCSIRRIDLALQLHHKMVKLESTFSINSYNFLLHELFRERRVEEAERIFEFMRRYSLLSCEGFAIMMTGLYREKKFREAMKLHDEMLKLGLKPNEKAYKRLISFFR